MVMHFVSDATFPGFNQVCKGSRRFRRSPGVLGVLGVAMDKTDTVQELQHRMRDIQPIRSAVSAQWREPRTPPPPQGKRQRPAASDQAIHVIELSSCRSPDVIVSTQVILERCVALQPGPLQVKCLNCGNLVGYPIDHKNGIVVRPRKELVTCPCWVTEIPPVSYDVNINGFRLKWGKQKLAMSWPLPFQMEVHWDYRPDDATWTVDPLGR